MFSRVSSLILMVSITFFIVPAKAADEVRLEALCSSNRAGVKWTASPTYRAQILLDFNCTNSRGDVILTKSQVQCFNKDDGLPLLAHTFHRSMTHVINKNLQLETTCIFTANVLDRFEEPLDAVIAHCTIGGPTALTLLPAVCEHNDGQCECSCNQGFEGIADNTIDGNICEASADPLPTPSVTVQSSTEAAASTISDSELNTAPFTTITTNNSERTVTMSSQYLSNSANIQPAMSSTASMATTKSILETATAIRSHIKESSTVGLTISSSTAHSTVSATPFGGSHYSGLRQSDMHTIIFVTVGIAAVILITAVCFYFGRVVYIRKKQKRWHKQQTMPFKKQKIEKINPDFYPDNLNIETIMPASESLHSMIHTLELHKKHKEDNATIAVIILDSDTLPNKEEKVTNGEKQESYVYSMSSGTSGYATEGSFLSESLMNEVSNYMDSICQEDFRRESQEEVDKESTESMFLPPVTSVLEDHSSSLSNSDNSLEKQNGINDQQSFSTTLHSKHCHKNERSCSNNSEQMNKLLLPQDYITPVLHTHISFNFPS